ncbi:hypothetical protein GGI21_004749, partial [Coemansia aciculifera]
MVELSTGEIARFYSAERNLTVTSPVILQVVSNIQVLRNQSASTLPSYRCMMTDGDRTSLVVIPNKLANLVADDTITRFTVLKITKCTVSQKPRADDTPMLFIIIVDAEVVETLSERIGGSAKSADQDDVGSAAHHSFADEPAAARSAVPRPTYQQPQQ